MSVFKGYEDPVRGEHVVEKDHVLSPTFKQNGDFYHWMFWCPGCDSPHSFDGRWEWNGDLVKPTFKPSLSVKWTMPEDGKKVQHHCHSFVTDGKIRFLNDCTHDSKGKTLSLPRWMSTRWGQNGYS